ncbi:DUF2336 domain-containing protein [Thalassospira alkalitolerans]|uniref:DUF2336 domain-containing protein n=1 Tax=Thalassospira alkalitolerans TaxID=1293890 RepID=UPI003AA8EAB0
MLNWMFNRQKSKDDGGLDDKSAAKLRDLAETVRSIAPDEFGANEQVSSRSGRIPRRKQSDIPSAQSGLDYAARLSADLVDDDDDEEDGQPDFDSDVRMDVARRLRRHLSELSPSERLDMVEEFVAAIGNMADCYRPQVIALIEQELSHTPYMTRQAAMRLRQDIAAIGRVSLGEYVELLSDADFLDILRGRGEFVQTASEKADAKQEAAAQARLARDRAEKEKGGLLNRFLASDDAPRNVVAMTPQFGAKRPASDKTPLGEMRDGRNKISRQAQRRIAHFILASLFDTLVEQGRMRAEVARAMRQSVRQRIEKAKLENRITTRMASVPSDSDIEDAMHGEDADPAGTSEPVTIDQYVLDALSRNEDALVVQGLAHYAQMPAAIVSKILDSGSARAITALAWRAGMTAPSAIVLQMSAAIPEENIERPAAGGRYAMAATDMDWYIDFFNELQPSGPRGRAAGGASAAGVAGGGGAVSNTASRSSDQPVRTRRQVDDRPQGPKGE